MLPITRVNLNNICCTCLIDVRRTRFAKNRVHVLNKKPNLFKALQATAYVTVLKDTKNLKFIDDYSRKLCPRCLSKVQDAYRFLEKIKKSSAQLKDLLVSGSNKTGTDVKNLKNCCRICLHRQKGEDYKKHIKWLQDFSGIENEEQLYNNKEFPKQLCGNCGKKIYDTEIFLLLSTFAFEYIASEIDKECKMQNASKNIDDNELPQKELMTVEESSSPQNFNKGIEEEVFMIKYEQEGFQYQEIVKLNNLPEDSNEQKDGKNHFTDISVYSTVVEGFSTNENHFSLKKEEYKDDIVCDFVVIDAEE